MLTINEIVSGNSVATSLSVAPLAVLPDFQKQGIGGKLLKEAHKRAALLGYGTAVLLGHKDYYPRFGYRKAMDFGIEFPFDVPDDFCMVIGLLPGIVNKVSGMVRYPAAFFEEINGASHQAPFFQVSAPPVFAVLRYNGCLSRELRLLSLPVLSTRRAKE